MSEQSDDDSPEKQQKKSSKVKTALGCGWMSIYLLMGIFEIFAIYDWLISRFEMNGFFAGLSAVFVAFIPGLGSLMAYWGATDVWGWESFNAILVFFWYYLPIAIYYSIGIFVLLYAIVLILFGMIKRHFKNGRR